MSEDSEEFGRGYFQRLMRGIFKLLLAGFIIGAISSISIPDLTVGDSTVSGTLIKALLEFAVPIYIILSALEDFGVKM
jgi:Na+/pantothenate symporter